MRQLGTADFTVMFQSVKQNIGQSRCREDHFSDHILYGALVHGPASCTIAFHLMNKTY